MHSLTLHPDCKASPVTALCADIRATSAGCEVEFRLEGALDSVRLPKPAPSQRASGLWQHTCFEFFWQPDGGENYHEFNLAPSNQWAAYGFDSYREGMRDADIGAIALASGYNVSNGQGVLELKASIAADLAAPAKAGLSAVIELTDGTLQYWALAFPPGKPDFHAAVCRPLSLSR